MVSFKWKGNLSSEGCAREESSGRIAKGAGNQTGGVGGGTGVSRQTIGSLENGRYNPSILLAFKIAHYFGMSIEDIFIYEEGTL